jgi:predicted HicB family RNase H-like nuclease
MDKQNLNELINKAKSSNQQKTIQKIVPIITKEIEEIQFSFYLEKELLKKLKLKALQEETSMKQLVNTAIKYYLEQL